jgi:hypothetical protein
MTDRIDLVRFQRAITTTANGTVVTGITAGANGSTTQLVLDSAGNVGIGTTVPAQKLEVAGSGMFKTGNADFVHVLSDSGAIELCRAAGDGYIDFKNSAAEDWDVRLQSVGAGGTFTVSTNGTERMRVSSAGIITTPFQSAIRLNGNNGNGFELGGNTQLLVSTYYNSVLSRGDLSWNSTTGRITAATAGYYAVMFQVYVQTGGTNNNGRLQIRKNGSEYQLMQTGLAADGTYDLCTVVQLSANDYIDIIIDSFDPMRLYMGPSHTVFHMFFLG